MYQYYSKPKKKFSDEYIDYIHSNRWLLRKSRYVIRLYLTRLLVFWRPRIRCSYCGSTYDLQLHHKTYERLGHEKHEDLCLLCDYCHSLVTEKKLKL